MENFWRFEIWKILFVCLFLEATLDFDYPLKKSGWAPFNLGFLIKINNFMKKMNDFNQNMLMVCKKIPPKFVKKDLYYGEYHFFVLSTLLQGYSHEKMLHMLKLWEKILYCHPRAQERPLGYPLFNNRMPAVQIVPLLNP